MKLLDSFVRTHSLSSSAASSTSSVYSKKHHFKYALFPCINSTCCRLYLHNAHKNVFHSFNVLIADATLNYRRRRRVCTIVNGTMMPVHITLVLMMNTQRYLFHLYVVIVMISLGFQAFTQFYTRTVYKCTLYIPTVDDSDIYVNAMPTVITMKRQLNVLTIVFGPENINLLYHTHTANSNNSS